LRTAENRDAEWYELRLRTEPSDDVLHFVNLFAAPDQQRLEKAVRVHPGLEDEQVSYILQCLDEIARPE